MKITMCLVIYQPKSNLCDQSFIIKEHFLTWVRQMCANTKPLGIEGIDKWKSNAKRQWNFTEELKRCYQNRKVGWFEEGFWFWLSILIWVPPANKIRKSLIENVVPFFSRSNLCLKIGVSAICQYSQWNI